MADIQSQQLTGNRQILCFSKNFDPAVAPDTYVSRLAGDGIITVYVEKNFSISSAEIVFDITASQTVNVIKNPNLYSVGYSTLFDSGGTNISSSLGGPWTTGVGGYQVVRSKNIINFIQPGQACYFLVRNSTYAAIFIDGFFERLT